jgi:hypothetical protein
MSPLRPASLLSRSVIAISIAVFAAAPAWASTSAPASADSAEATSSLVRLPSGSASPETLSVGSPRNHAGKALVLPFRTVDPGALRAAQLRASAHISVAQRHPLDATKLSSDGLFNGLNQPGLSDYAVTPPDSTGAIGPSHYVEMVNQQVGVYDRNNLGLVSQLDLTSFVGASALDIVSDPQVEWDGQANRWLYAAVDVYQGDNFLLLGWSKTADPSDLSNGWCRFGIGRGHKLDDYPKLGHHDEFILIGSNVYDDTNGPDYEFETATVWAVAKPPVGDASCAGTGPAYYFGDPANPLLNEDGSPAYTPVPANSADASPLGYVVAAHTPLSGDNQQLGPQDKLMLWHFVANAGVPNMVTDGDVGVSTFDLPAPAPQPGSENTLDTLDARLTQAVAVNDPTADGAKGIWTQHTINGPGNRSVVRWYELVPGAPGGLPRQQGEVSSATDFMFNAAISPAKGGDAAAIFYNRSSPTQLPIIGGLTRGPSTPLGSMDAEELVLGSSTAVDQDPSCAPPRPCRWGDYSGATPDPVNAGVVWGSNQITGPCFILCGWFSQWQTRNFAVVTNTAPPATVPAAPQSLSATGSDGAVTLTWSAPSTDGGSPITHYEIYRGTSSGGEVWVAETGNVLSFADAGLTNGTTYYYRISAKNGVGEGPQSNEASATPQQPPPPASPPSAPTLLSATPANGQVTLSWSAPASDGGAPVTFYTIYRGTRSGGESFLVTVGNVLSYVDAGLSNGTTYFYEVAAVNSAGTGPVSNELSATPALPDFSLSATPASRTAARGMTTTYTMTATSLGGYSGNVSLSASISPKARGTTTAFNPSTLVLPTTSSSTLTVRVGKNTARGTYTITITATGGGLTRTTTVTLVVT